MEPCGSYLETSEERRGRGRSNKGSGHVRFLSSCGDKTHNVGSSKKEGYILARDFGGFGAQSLVTPMLGLSEAEHHGKGSNMEETLFRSR